MAVRLDIPSTPYWIDLGYGVRHKVRPCTTVLLSTLQAKASRLAAAMLEPAEAERLAGMADAKDLSDEEIRDGFFQLYLAILLAQAATIEWEGYEGNPPVTDDHVAAAMRIPMMAQAFMRKYLAPVEALAEEGKG